MSEVREVMLPRRVRPQPQPHLNPGGDCGPCVLAGLLGWEVSAVYERLRGGKVGSLQWYEMRDALWAAGDLFDRIVEDPPIWLARAVDLRTFGNPVHLHTTAWFNYVRLAVDAGYYALAPVSFRKLGPTGPGSDHWVLLCGVREIDPPPGGGLVHQQVLVSCSAKSTPAEEWVEAGDFLRERGGGNLLLARPPADPPREPRTVEQLCRDLDAAGVTVAQLGQAARGDGGAGGGRERRGLPAAGPRGTGPVSDLAHRLLAAEKRLRKLAADAAEFPGQLHRLQESDDAALRLGADALNLEAAERSQSVPRPLVLTNTEAEHLLEFLRTVRGPGAKVWLKRLEEFFR